MEMGCAEIRWRAMPALRGPPDCYPTAIPRTTFVAPRNASAFSNGDPFNNTKSAWGYGDSLLNSFAETGNRKISKLSP